MVSVAGQRRRSRPYDITPTSDDGRIEALQVDVAGALSLAETAKQDAQAAKTTADASKSRFSHSGTQTASTISDFQTAVAARVAAMLLAGSNVSLVVGSGGDTVTISSTGGAGMAASYETVAKNLDADGAVFSYDINGNLDMITYASGVTKTFVYSGDDLSQVILGGSIPPGIATTKAFVYASGVLTNINYT